MKNLSIIFLFVMSSCSTYEFSKAELDWVAQYPGEEERIEKIRDLCDDLTVAEHNLANARERERHVQERYNKALIDFFRNRVGKFGKKILRLERDQKAFNVFLKSNLQKLFLKEREVLIKIIEKGDNHDLDAQEVLDSILAIITKLSEKKTFLNRPQVQNLQES